jgi:glycosyltransferase involved in cell wall biosynthesis
VKVDVLFVSWNRLAYTAASFAALAANTNWSLVERLWLADDGSEDGTRELLAKLVDGIEAPHAWVPAPFGGPVQAVNRYLPNRSDCAEAFAKVDNDTVVCPGWLDELVGLLDRHPDIDLLGVRPDIGPPQTCPYKLRGVRYAPFVDGNGLWRHRAFDGRPRPRPMRRDSRQGFTQWQQARPDVKKAWANPDLPVFQLDCLPLEPWRSLGEEYAARGWQRGWPNAVYPEDASAYWDWWAPAAVEAPV